MISAIGSGAAEPGKTSKTGELGKQDFLKLLVTQLKAQDPMNPQDGTEFVAQLAQFTSLERLVNIEDGLGNVAMATLSTNATMASSFIGKTVRLEGDGITYDGARPVTMDFDLQKGAKSVTISVVDENGKVVEEIEAGEKSEGANTVVWNGLTHDGENESRAAAGKYTFRVTAKDAEGNDIETRTQILAKVDAVHFSGSGVPELVLESGKKVPLSEVNEVQASD